MEVNDPRAALSALATNRGVSLAALSRLIGRNAAYLQQFVTRGSPRLLAEADRRVLAAYLGVDETVLGALPPSAASVRVARTATIASAGPGGLIDDDRSAGAAMVDAGQLRRLGVRVGDLSVVVARGDSMLPTIADGDEMLVDLADRSVDAKGGIYVARIDDAVVVKRLEKRGRAVAVISDNPDYPTIVSEGVTIVGRVVRLSRLLR